MSIAADRGHLHGRRPDDRSGAALLVVIGATAALAVPVTLLLFAAGTAYDVQGYRRERQQAEQLVRAVVLQAAAALEAGSVPSPAPGRTVTVRNGVLEGAGRTVDVARFPRPPAADWPPLTDAPPLGEPPVFGVGAEVTLSSVIGPRGEARGRSLTADGSRLIDLRVRAWYRRAVATRRVRALLEGGRLLLLD